VEIKETQIDQLVQAVLKNLQQAKTESKPAEAAQGLGIFPDMNSAVEAAKVAYKKLRALTVEDRERIVQKIRQKAIENAKVLAEMGVKETGMGRVDHKILKHQLLANKTPGTEDLKTTAWSGDKGLTLIEMGPFGVIGAITPSTNPSETVLCNSIGMIAAGNTVVFNPHPGAINTSNLAIKLVNEASIEAGGPENIVVSVAKTNMEQANVLLKHKDITLIAATGGPGVVTAALSNGKRALGAGAGNPPVVVDETADIKKAAKDIVDGATFDNNLPCIAEKEVVVVDKVADELIYWMQQNGCYQLAGKYIDKLVNLVLNIKDGRVILNRDWVGKDAYKILNAIGINAGPEIRCIILEANKEHILVDEELMMPILGIVRAKDVDEAIEIAVELEHGNRHSAHMHSKNLDNLTKFGREVDTAIFVKNAPSYAALGFGGEGYCTFTIASRTGEGLTSAKTFTKSRRCVLADGLSIR
jgi:propionaldehyde dehydrogenase